MSNSFHSFALRLATVNLVGTFFFALTAFGQTKATNFGLKDQNDRHVEVNFPSDRPVVLIFGDRKGAGQIDGWSKPLYEAYSDKAYIFGIASLSGVPSYARGLVPRLIKRQTSYSVLLGRKSSRFVRIRKEQGASRRPWKGRHSCDEAERCR